MKQKSSITTVLFFCMPFLETQRQSRIYITLYVEGEEKRKDVILELCAFTLEIKAEKDIGLRLSSINRIEKED